jgi:hypothetical protein
MKINTYREDEYLVRPRSIWSKWRIKDYDSMKTSVRCAFKFFLHFCGETVTASCIDYRGNDGWSRVSAQDCQLPTPTSQKLRLE